MQMIFHVNCKVCEEPIEFEIDISGTYKGKTDVNIDIVPCKRCMQELKDEIEEIKE